MRNSIGQSGRANPMPASLSASPLVQQALNALRRPDITPLGSLADGLGHSTHPKADEFLRVVLDHTQPTLPYVSQLCQNAKTQQPAAKQSQHVRPPHGNKPVLVLGTAAYPVTLENASATGAGQHITVDQKHVAWLIKKDFDCRAMDKKQRESEPNDTSLPKALLYCLGQILRLRAENEALGKLGNSEAAVLSTALLGRIKNILSLSLSIHTPVRISEENICAPMVAVAAYLADFDALQLFLGHHHRFSEQWREIANQELVEWLMVEIAYPVASAVHQTPMRNYREPSLIDIMKMLVSSCLTFIERAAGDSTQIKIKTQIFLTSAINLAHKQQNAFLLSAICQCESPWLLKPDNDDMILFFLSAAAACWLEGIEIWLDYGIKIDVRRPEAYLYRPKLWSGYTALHFAAMQTNPLAHNNAVRVVDLLLKRGANPVMLAAESAKSDQIFISFVADSPLFLACKANNVEAINLLGEAERKLMQQDQATHIAQIKWNIDNLTSVNNRLQDAPLSQLNTLVSLASNLTFAWTMCLGHLRNCAWYQDLQDIWVFGMCYTDPERIKKTSDNISLAASKMDTLARFKQALAQVISDSWVENASLALSEDALYDKTRFHSSQVGYDIYDLTRLIRAGHFAAAERLAEVAPNSSPAERRYAARLCLAVLLQTSQSRAASNSQEHCRKLFRCLLNKVDRPFEAFGWVMAAIDTEQAEMLPAILEHAAHEEISFWQPLCEAESLHNFLYCCIQRSWSLVGPVLKSVPSELWPDIALLRTEEGDTCLHVAVQRRDPFMFNFLLEAIQPNAQMLAQQNVAGRGVIEEALARGALYAVNMLYERLVPSTQQAFIAAAGPIVAQALVCQQVSVRKPFLQRVVNDALFNKDPLAWQTATLHEVARLGDQHALYTAVKLLPEAACTALEKQTNLLHVVVEHFPDSIAGLRKHLKKEALSHLAAKRDQHNLYPEDYTDSHTKRHLLQNWRINASEIALKVEEGPYVAELTKLLQRINEMPDVDSCEAAADRFVERAGELTASTGDADKAEEMHRYLVCCGWQVLRALDRPDGPGIGKHFFVHYFTTSLDSLRRRALSFAHAGGTRFGENDSIALLRLRRRALSRVAQVSGLDVGEVVIELQDETLHGDGMLSSSIGGPLVYHPNLKYVRFVMFTSPSGVISIRSMFPVAGKPA